MTLPTSRLARPRRESVTLNNFSLRRAHRVIKRGRKSKAMSKMTSSICAVADNLARRQQANAASAAATTAAAATRDQRNKKQPAQAGNLKQAFECNGLAAKRLTDFSIDSIIGGHGEPVRQDGTATTMCCTAPASMPRAQLLSPPAAPAPPAQTAAVARGQVGKFENDERCKWREHLSGVMVQQSILSKMDLDLPEASTKKSRPKSFLCSWCPVSFSNNGQLRNHERIHTGERPFRCEYSNCDKTFTRNEELTRHKLIHTKVRPHACSWCDKSFGRKDHLKKHERTHERRKVPDKRRSQAGSAGRPLVVDRGEANIFMPLKREATDYKELAALPRQLAMQMQPYSAQLAHANRATLSRPVQFAQQPAALNPMVPVTYADTLLSNQIASLAAVAAVAATTANQTATTATTCPPTTMNMPLNPQRAATMTSPAMQKMANDYWQEWFSLLDQQGQQRFFRSPDNDQ